MRILIFLLGLFLYVSTPSFADDAVTVSGHSLTVDCVAYCHHAIVSVDSPSSEVEPPVQNFLEEQPVPHCEVAPFYTGSSPPCSSRNSTYTFTCLNEDFVTPWIEPLFFRLCSK